MTDIYWTFEKDGEVFDAEFKTRDRAIMWAQTIFDELCIDDGLAFGRMPITLIAFRLDDDGNPEVVGTEEYELEYERTRSDMEEHGTWHSGAGGVI